MSRFIVLDSTPLGLLTHSQESPEVQKIWSWLVARLEAEDRVIVPAIIYYELKRELLRAGKKHSLVRLDEFAFATPGRYLPLSDEALRLSANLWAEVRRLGKPTSDLKSIDFDVILAAQALSFGPSPSDIVVATSNERHISRFLSASPWSEIR